MNRIRLTLRFSLKWSISASFSCRVDSSFWLSSLNSSSSDSFAWEKIYKQKKIISRRFSWKNFSKWVDVLQVHSWGLWSSNLFRLLASDDRRSPRLCNFFWIYLGGFSSRGHRHPPTNGPRKMIRRFRLVQRLRPRGSWSTSCSPIVQGSRVSWGSAIRPRCSWTAAARRNPSGWPGPPTSLHPAQ